MSNQIHTHIDPDLEARITALVLGEIAEFDVEELERTIKKHPELQIFRRRMESIHQLLSEAVPSKKAPENTDWKLSEARRSALLETFAKTPSASSSSSNTHTRRSILLKNEERNAKKRRLWLQLSGVAAVLILGVFTFAQVVVFPSRDISFSSEIISYQAAPDEKKGVAEDLDDEGSDEQDMEVYGSYGYGGEQNETKPTRKAVIAQAPPKPPTLDELPIIGHLFVGDVEDEAPPRAEREYAIAGASQKTFGTAASEEGQGRRIGRNNEVAQNNRSVTSLAGSCLRASTKKTSIASLREGKISRGKERGVNNFLHRSSSPPTSSMSSKSLAVSSGDKLKFNEEKLDEEILLEKESIQTDKSDLLPQREFKANDGRIRGKRKIRSSKKPSKDNGSRQRPSPQNEETLTSAQPYSTFSLNVSDVSFQLAKVALLEKGRWPEASKVRTEEFVNAFDYNDPAPRRHEPVACTVEQCIHPFLQQRNLLRIGIKTAALGRATPLNLTIVLDNSGSMEREDREASVIEAIRLLAKQLNDKDQITLVSFASSPRLLADRLNGSEAEKLVSMIKKTPSEGGTNLEEALKTSFRLASRSHKKGVQDRIILITDGIANLGNTVPSELSNLVEKMRQKGIAFDACGVGANGLNDEILEALTRKGDGRYYFLNSPKDADAGFAKKLAGSLTPVAKNVKVQVVFNPSRVVQYKLLGFEKHRLHKEDFRNDAVDAAEMSAEEAGNAVYQIKVNPMGEGDLGEVFVRFFDVNSQRMVERSWTLPYDSNPEPFSQTSPSMQLAGLASQLGEKLHGTDDGTVDLSKVKSSIYNVKNHYKNSPKVQDFIRMCEKVMSDNR